MRRYDECFIYLNSYAQSAYVTKLKTIDKFLTSEQAVYRKEVVKHLGMSIIISSLCRLARIEISIIIIIRFVYFSFIVSFVLFFVAVIVCKCRKK